MTIPLPAAAPPGGAADSRPEVLVVEQNPASTDAASDLVRRPGFRVTAVADMPDALTVLRERQFTLVLLDLQMAAEDAVGWLQQLRLRDSGDATFATAGNTPVIAVTAREQAMNGERLRELGFDDHLAKPLRASQVRMVLNQHLLPAAASPSNAVIAGVSAMQASMKAAAPDPVLDREVLGRLVELDPTGQARLIQRVLQAFQSSSARLRAEAGAACVGDDRKAMRLVAHTLKSSSASIGAMHLSQICAGIETAIRVESGEDFGAQLAAMNAALDPVLLRIDALLRDLP